MEISKKAFVRDMIINMIATAIPVAVLNIVIYPLLASRISTDDYGTMSTCVGLFSFVNGVWGLSISQTRLLDKSKDLIQKNYSVLLCACALFAVVMNTLMLIITGCFVSNINVIMLSVCVLLNTLNAYLIVEYRIILSYSKILISNVLLSVGYFVGFGMFALTGFSRWEWIFVFGYGLMAFFNLLSTRIWRSKLNKDERFGAIAKSTSILVLSSAISGSSTYLDKFVIYPMLGPTIMAYYQTASLIAKVIPMFAGAISNVILSYLVKLKIITKKTFWLFVAILIAIAAVGLVICNIVVNPVIKFLYPTYYEFCYPIVPYTNVIAILSMIYYFLLPLSLRYTKRSMQYVIQLGRLIPYIVLTFILFNLFGLYGFCYATMISQFIQISLVIVVTFRAITSVKKQEIKTDVKPENETCDL